MTTRGAARIELPDGFWSEPATVAVLRARPRSLGRLFELVCRRAGASQTQIGVEVGMAQPEVARYVSGARRAQDIDVLERVADGLGMPDAARALFGLAPSPTHGEQVDVKRREFLMATGAALVGVTAGLTVAPGTRLGASDVARLRGELAELYALDDAAGGAAAFERSLAQATSARHVLDSASCGPTVERDLQVLTGELVEMAGWSAFDLGRHGEARQLFGEALTLAHVSESGPLATLVMASMSLQCSAVGAGREAVRLARAAQRAARPFGSARLLSLLAAREALGHARCGDEAEASAALARSESLLDDADDPGQEWLAFWGPADFHGAVAGVHQRVGHLEVAERSVRAAIEATPERYARNRAGYLAQLAEVLAHRCEPVAAARVAVSAASVDVGSERVTGRLRGLRPLLAPYEGEEGVGECLTHLAAL